MASYTIEDIEMIRRKSGISYQEAVSLLDYHNGNVARALVDLERNGRIKPEAARTAKTESADKPSSGKSGKNGFVDFCSKLYRARIKINKDSTPVLNLSALFGIVTLLISPHVVITGAIVSLILGYKISFTKNDPAFASEDLEKMVRNAADNVKTSVGDIARGFQGESASASAPETKDAADESAPSYYATRGAASAAYHRPSVPTINVPVQVESQDGSVSMDSDDEGYTSATVE